MDGFNEKKWFIYIGDHHEGPFSMEELQPRFEDGTLTPRSYAWCEGMDDWKPLLELSSFEGFLSQKTPQLSDAETVAIPVETDLSSTRVHTQIQVSEDSAPHGDPSHLSRQEPAVHLAPVVHLSATTSITPQADAAPKTNLKESTPNKVSEQKGEASRSSGTSQKGRPFYRSGAIQMLFLVTLVVGAVRLGQLGHLDPVLDHPFTTAIRKTVSDLIQPVSLHLVEKFPTLGSYVSPLPQFSDVSADDYEDLRSGAVGDLQQTGAKVSVALSLESPTSPRFYVSSNLPDGAVFDVYVEGISSTLLNHLSFKTRVSVSMDKKWGLTEIIRAPGGETVPQGEYVIHVLEAEAQAPEIAQKVASLPSTTARVPADLPQGRKVIAKKIYFLGGLKNEEYTARLKEFHDRLRQKAEAELGELKQFVSTLTTQFEQTQTQYGKSSKGKGTAATVKKWTEFHQQWIQLDQQLNETFTTWTPEKLDRDFFYGSMYRELIQVAQAVRTTHEFHHRYFSDKAADRNSLGIQIGESTSQSETALNQARLHLEQILASPTDAAGLPTRPSSL